MHVGFSEPVNDQTCTHIDQGLFLSAVNMEIKMPDLSLDGRVEEASILTRAIENHFRKLVRFLVGKVSLIKLQEMIRYIFVDEIENKLRREHPTRNISLSQLALLSGLDTRTLTKIRNNPKYGHPFHKEANFLKQFVLGASILDEWSSKAPYIDQESGKPKALNISGKRPSFESLFLDSTKSRGVTYNSLLGRLIESGAVSLNDANDKVYLVTNSFLPSNSEDRLGAIEIGFSAIDNLTDTVINNINALETGGDRLFQRGAWTYQLNPDNKNKLRQDLNLLFEKTDKSARRIIKQYEEETSSSDYITAGVSFFYFEE